MGEFLDRVPHGHEDAFNPEEQEARALGLKPDKQKRLVRDIAALLFELPLYNRG